MSDVVVTVPKGLWAEWLGEGDLAYADESRHPAGWAGDYEYGFLLGGTPPQRIEVGVRVYVVAHGRLRGYAPLAYIERWPRTARFDARPGQYALVRKGEAVACTIPGPVRGFQGYRYRWWDRSVEVPYPEWRTEGVA